MSTEERGLKIDAGSASWSLEPDTNVEITKSASNAVASVPSASSGSDDDANDIEQGKGIWASSQQQHQPSTLTSSISPPPLRSIRPTVSECLHVPKEEMADLPLDVYNMFFLSGIGSQGFYYSVAIFIIKISLYTLLLLDLIDNKKFPSQQKVVASTRVKVTQLFLMPVAIMMQEELVTSFFVISHLKYSPGIKRRHPGAYKWSK
mmetsp:Transcript_4523/g.9925  ORF Transcript_4523/g.9925 Transcript_4523/m.9925 type:complete len:205 (-) Transcript_4523:367-981(-)